MALTARRISKPASRPKQNERPVGFAQLDGTHSWQNALPGTFVLYPVRKLHAGEILYFNFKLAKEMGLIAADHPHVMSKSLKKEILDTFAIRILNEYDQKQNVHYHPAMMKPNKYMATRYLQLQHSDKSGRTSGDGRSIWNGEVEYRGQTWDVSSRGTGVTCLSPGMVQARKPLRSGSTEFGYGCGLADIDELLGAAIMAEIFYNNNIHTERVLCVIDIGGGNGIGVRAGQNLIRPAHLFLHLKQGHYENLKNATDYFIDRQFSNGEWGFNSQSSNKYNLMLERITEDFAKFSAQLDRDYIFAWLDWDGDNVLANAGIIDYGSIRQFGLRHDEYRYDDVDRFSTSLREQKSKARLLVQTFVQLVDFLTTKRKKVLRHFDNHSALGAFDRHFDLHSCNLFLAQAGLPLNAREKLLAGHLPLVEKLYRLFTQLESTKTKKKMRRVPDGINRPAIFNMRSILVDLPMYLLAEAEHSRLENLPTEIFFELILADSARGADRMLTASLQSKINQFQMLYKVLIRKAASDGDLKSLLQRIISHSKRTNRPNRLTGDGLLYVVDKILSKKRRKQIAPEALQVVIDKFIIEQSPQSPSPELKATEALVSKSASAQRLYRDMLSLVDDNKESI
jgi:hypothetical protein